VLNIFEEVAIKKKKNPRPVIRSQILINLSVRCSHFVSSGYSSASFESRQIQVSNHFCYSFHF